MSWMGVCNVCGKMRQAGHGLFCSIYLLGRGGFRPCRNVWCGACYREAASDPFPRLDKNEEANGFDLHLDMPETYNHYRCGRNGDHLMGVPFKCDLCSFRNVTGRDPVLGSHNDHFTLVAIQRVLLDVMWAREPDTVAGNWARSRRVFLTAVNHLSLRTESLLPVLGNPTVSDRLGMGVAILTVVTSLRAGINSFNIQYDIMQKTQTWYGDAFDAGREYICDTVVGLDQKKQYLSSSHTFRKWFSHFMKGAQLRMGMILRQNEALTSPMVLACAPKQKGIRAPRRARGRELRWKTLSVLCSWVLGQDSEARRCPC
jgi:hypothetical protein